MPLLAADPYYFNNSRHFDKEEFIRRDVDQIMSMFNKNEAEVYEASRSYVGREEHLFLFTNALKFWRNAIEVQLTDQSTNLATLVTIFCAEAMLGHEVRGNSNRFRNFLLNYLSREEKIELLSGYTFGTPYMLGTGRFRKKHLCHRAVVLSEHGRYYNREYCSSGNVPLCECRNWLNNTTTQKIDRYLNMLGTYFYRMRNSVVHDAGFVQFTSMPYFEEAMGGTIVPTTADAFSHHQSKTYTSYDTDITVQRFHEIMKHAAWRCFVHGSRITFKREVNLLVRF